MRRLPLALFLLAPLAHGEGTCALPAKDLRGLRVWDQAPTGVEPGKGDLLKFAFQASFKNDTPHELASVSVQMIVELSGRRAYVSPPLKVRRFNNVSVPHVGSLLPLNKTEMVRNLRFDVPARYWRSDTHRYLKVVGAEGFVDPDLHDPGHLYNRLVNGTDEDQIPLFQKDPSLLKVRNREGLTPLLMAFGTCGPKMIRFLLAHGASSKERTNRGATIMHMAAINGYPGVQDLALKLGGDVNGRTTGGKTPLFRSIIFGRPACWRWLLKHGAKPNLADKSGDTPAKYAIREGQKEALADLAKAGVGVRSKDADGRGWMHYAVFNYLMMDAVKGAGVPIDDPNPKTGETPLMTAAWSGWLEPQVWLLQHGADPFQKDRSGKSAFDYAGLYSAQRMEKEFKRRKRKPTEEEIEAMAEQRARARDYFEGLVRQYATKRGGF